jgi:hypothetical protein
MVETNRSAASEWEFRSPGSGDYTPIAPGTIVISGPCVECRQETESVVRGDVNSVVFLCPPCGKAIREGRLV